MKKLYRVFLWVREVAEKQRRRELIKKIAQRIYKEKELEDIQKRKENLSSQFGGEAQRFSLPAWYMAQFLQYIDWLREEENRKEFELKKLIDEEDAERRLYMEAKRGYDVAQRFVERKTAEERKNFLKKEEKLSDDFVLVELRKKKED